MKLYTMGFEDALNDPHEVDENFKHYEEYAKGFEDGDAVFSLNYQIEQNETEGLVKYHVN